MEPTLAILSTLREEFQGRIQEFVPGVQRETQIPTPLNKIMTAIGMRRTGKTHLLMQAAVNLIKNQVSPQQILYINFEDDRLQPISQEKLRNLLDGFYSLYPENHDQECYLFLDEIQNVDDWPLVVRRYFDSKKVKIFLTGSSSKLLSKEIHTSLRGRSFKIEVWPYSFKEFLQTQAITLPKTFGQANLDKFTSLLRSYIESGGFPEIYGWPLGIAGGYQSSMGTAYRRQILQNYIDVVTLKDIIERNNISNPLPLEYMISFILKNTGSLLSVHKMHRDLKNQGFAVGKNSVHDYLSYIEDAYLAFSVPIFSESLRKVRSNPQKFYVIDTGLANAVNFGFLENTGHYFENLIYLDLRRAGHDIYYYRTQTKSQEVDFYTKDQDGQSHLFQVCWNTTDKQTLTRETSALQLAERELGITGILITPHTYFSEFLPLLDAN